MAATAIYLASAIGAVVPGAVLRGAAVADTVPQSAVASPGAADPGKPLSREEINERFVQRVLASIAGRSEEPAERVFKTCRSIG